MGVTWGVSANPSFETGISKGVFFNDSFVGVPWNGLTSVEELITSSDPKPIYQDGRKLYNIAPSRTFQATLRAFSVPVGFDKCRGYASVVPGVILTGQPRSTFGLAYQTNVGVDGRRIHLIYNATASPTKQDFNTLDDSFDAPVQEWRIDAVPPASSTYQPSAHLIIDSTRMPDYMFRGVENALYGTATANPVLWSQAYFRNLLGNRLIEPITEPV